MLLMCICIQPNYYENPSVVLPRFSHISAMTSFPSTAVLYGGYVTDEEDANPLVPYLNRTGRNKNYSSSDQLDNSRRHGNSSQHENGRGHNFMHHYESSVSYFTSLLPNVPRRYDALTLVNWL